MTKLHAQSWKAGINAPSTLEGCVCGWRVEPASILESSKQYEQHVAAEATLTVDDLFDHSDTVDDDTILGADAERAALANEAQELQSKARPLTPREAAAVDAATMMARASEAAMDVVRGTAARIVCGEDRYKLALLSQLLEAQFIAGAAFGAQRAVSFAVGAIADSKRETSEGDKT